jgi:hypothetical protein
MRAIDLVITAFDYRHVPDIMAPSIYTYYSFGPTVSDSGIGLSELAISNNNYTDTDPLPVSNCDFTSKLIY